MPAGVWLATREAIQTSGTSILSSVGTTTASGIDLAPAMRDWQTPRDRPGASLPAARALDEACLGVRGPVPPHKGRALQRFPSAAAFAPHSRLHRYRRFLPHPQPRRLA